MELLNISLVILGAIGVIAVLDGALLFRKEICKHEEVEREKFKDEHKRSVYKYTCTKCKDFWFEDVKRGRKKI